MGWAIVEISSKIGVDVESDKYTSVVVIDWRDAGAAWSYCQDKLEDIANADVQDPEVVTRVAEVMRSLWPQEYDAWVAERKEALDA